jgi:thiamine pyrophosphokinase
MKKCVIFCAGEFAGLAALLDGVVIAADGGLQHTQALGIKPDVILGDFDSLGYTPEGATVFPVEKDDTDAMLAVRRGLEMGCDSFVIYGGLDGPRLDHTIAMFQTLQYLADQGATGCAVGNSCIAKVVKNGEIAFPENAEGIISVFCMGADAEGVTIKGLKYGLENGKLTSGFPLGVSNHFVGENANISVKDGSLLIIYPKEVGIV